MHFSVFKAVGEKTNINVNKHIRLYLSYLAGVVVVPAAALKLQLSIATLQAAHLTPEFIHLRTHANLAASTVQQLL